MLRSLPYEAAPIGAVRHAASKGPGLPINMGMDGAGRVRSVEFPRELVEDARFVEDEAWRAVADLRQSRAPGDELLRAIRLLERATASRVRLQQG